LNNRLLVAFAKLGIVEVAVSRIIEIDRAVTERVLDSRRNISINRSSVFPSFQIRTIRVGILIENAGAEAVGVGNPFKKDRV
jgi:hypothetical protein